MGGVFVIFRLLVLPPLLLSWECLGMVVTWSPRDRVRCPHTHTGSEGLIHGSDTMKAQWEREPRSFFFPLSLPFPIYLLWPEAPANNSTHGSQYCILQTWPHVASGLLQAKKGRFCAGETLSHWRMVARKARASVFAHSHSAKFGSKKRQLSAGHRQQFFFAMGHCLVLSRVASPIDKWVSPILLASATWSGS